MFAGLELLPMACTDAREPSKTLPRSFLWAFSFISLNAFLLIFAAGCNAPGSFFVGISIDSPLYYGDLLKLLIFPGHHAARLIEMLVLLSFLRLRSRFSSLRRFYTQPFGVSAAYVGLVIIVFVSSDLLWYGSNNSFYTTLLTLGIFLILLVLATIWYMIRVKSRQRFSEQEQEIMFQAYVINANTATRHRRRMANHSQQVSSVSPGLKGKNDKKQAINKGILSRLTINCYSPAVKEQSSVTSSTIKATTMIELSIQEGNTSHASAKSRSEYSNQVLHRDHFHRIGEEDETCPEQQVGNDNAMSTISAVSEKKPLFSISSELIENIVKKRPGYKPHEKRVSPRCAIVPDNEVENMLNSQSRQGSRSSSELRQSTLLGLRPSASKSRSIDDDNRSALVVPLSTIHDEEENEDKAGVLYGAMKLFRSSSKPHLKSVKSSSLRKSIQDHLSQYLPSPELLFQDKLFEEKVEEMLFLKSLSLGSSLDSSRSMDEAVGVERGKLHDDCNEGDDFLPLLDCA
eukprot:gene4191-4605_t